MGKARRKERDGDQNSADTKLYLEESVLERKLPDADLKALVDLPAGLDYNEWLASHTLALFEHVNLVYGTISEFCTPSGCPDMTGPGNRTYLWFDEKGKKTRVAAPQYIDYVMTFTQKTVSDETIFPTKYANEFPSSFESIARKILRLQFHVIAHLYAGHFREIALLGLHTHLNLTFAHLTALHRRFNLIDEKETDVLRDLEIALRLTDDTTQTTTSIGGVARQNQHNYDNNMCGNKLTQQQDSNSGGSAAIKGEGYPPHDALDVEMLQQTISNTTSKNIATGTTLTSTNTLVTAICRQPQAHDLTSIMMTLNPTSTMNSTSGGDGFGIVGSSNLIGGILGDLTSEEFGDTMQQYCLTAIPSATTSTTVSPCPTGHCDDSDGGKCEGCVQTSTITIGAGAVFLNNNNDNMQQQHQYHHHYHNQYQQFHHHNYHQSNHTHQQHRQHQNQQQKLLETLHVNVNNTQQQESHEHNSENTT